MDSIAPLYINDIGIVFYWKREGKLLSHRMQLVFRDMGFYLTEEELVSFGGHIHEAVRQGCKGCPAGCQQKRRLTTPYPQIELAVSGLELQLLEDLVEGALFRLRLLDFVSGVGRN
ncbi:MAG TPA: hypothetical protein VK183_12825 [Flavobacterium sp.]|nr:hypothetical protein [Flavobacterium sp.]